MVHRYFSVKAFRHIVPFFGLLALGALFLKMPETPNFFGLYECKACVSGGPFLPLFGAGYFTILIALSLLFPAFPSPRVAKGGLIWALLLTIVLTRMNWPHLCYDCLFAHSCHILIWSIWFFIPAENSVHSNVLREKLGLTFFSAVSVMALFSCLNLTFMAYGFKASQSASATLLKPGDAVPLFTLETQGKGQITYDDLAKIDGFVINFISPDCPYCQQQLPILDSVAKAISTASRFVNISPTLPQELMAALPHLEWVEDKEGALRELFKVSGYPTLFIISSDGTIAEIIPGLSDTLKESLFSVFKEKNI